MENKNKNILNIIKVLVVIVLSYIAVKYENAVGIRLTKIITLIIFYIFTGLIRSYLCKKKIAKVVLFLVDIVVIFLLELQTKFVINYTFHIFYIIILFEVALSLDKKTTKIIGIITVFASLFKYVSLLCIISNYTRVTETLFFTFINIFTVAIVVMFKSYKEEKEKTQSLYNELVKTSEKVEELAIIKERNRIASELHDSIGHNITGLIMQLEMAEYFLEHETEEAKKLIIQSKQTSRDSLVQLRKVVDALKEPMLEGDFVYIIKNLAKNFMQMTNIKTEIINNCDKNMVIPEHIKKALFRVIQEAMTNSAKHGKAKKIQITITNNIERVELLIEDDGEGCKDIVFGNGLKGIQRRIENIGGKVGFDGNKGFKIIVQVFLEG